MRKSSLPSVHRFLQGRFIKFIISGTINTFVDWSSYFILIYVLHVSSEEAAKAISAFVGINSAFFFNTFWVFNDKFKTFSENHIAGRRQAFVSSYLRVLAIYSFGLLVNVLIFSLVNKISDMVLLALFVATLFTFIFNYLFVKNAAYESSSLWSSKKK